MSTRILFSTIRRCHWLNKGFAAVPVRYYGDIPKIYRPYGKTGDGNYGSTLGKQNVGYVEPVREQILSLAKTLPFTDKDSVFNIADYGAADGSTAMAIFRELLATLKDHHGPNTQFQVIYEDLEMNDFNSLFKRMSGIIPDPPSYLQEMDNVYVLASGTNFYKQCVPSNSIHFMMSMTSVHWLSRTPTTFKDSIYKDAKSSTEETAALHKQAELDWETFLLKRSRELKRGGLLVVGTCAEFEGRNTGENRYMLQSFIGLLNEVWKEYSITGKITKDEFINTNLSFCLPNMEQVRKPFDDKTSPVSRSGLSLLSAEAVVNPDVFYNNWREKKDKEGIDEREEFARMYVYAHRNWSNSTFMNGLSDSRSLEEKEQIVDGLYDDMKKRISRMNPEIFKDDLRFIYLVIRKE
ncbi:S-adenosyl-L-methionine:benzoic acid/salicylic acid carboxyl methyltransferase 3-like [Haliotis rubra]|uniref:S-adenosyl-L-methionine:benzoic acid/salicylic acid carboxyl methyltransferase 3-like n=1 Tax=Haliotis rubra TaxID=36100 RepID=UPI001EE57730|nr:S-adenosyl-L-methionine:benzoic acid/salicylic acid carboxyl methyltransferase 3-like [Haliotis rubra]